MNTTVLFFDVCVCVWTVRTEVASLGPVFKRMTLNSILSGTSPLFPEQDFQSGLWSDGISAEPFWEHVPTVAEHDAVLLPRAQRNVTHLPVAVRKEDYVDTDKILERKATFILYCCACEPHHNGSP